MPPESKLHLRSNIGRLQDWDEELGGKLVLDGVEQDDCYDDCGEACEDCCGPFEIHMWMETSCISSSNRIGGYVKAQCECNEGGKDPSWSEFNFQVPCDDIEFNKEEEDEEEGNEKEK